MNAQKPFLTRTEATQAALAMVGPAEVELIAVLRDGLWPVEQGDAPAILLEEMAPTGGPVSSVESTALLHRLAEQAPALFVTLHERALTLLARQLPAIDPVVEQHYVAALDRLATYWAPHEPHRLAGLMATVREVPLTSVAGRQLRRYFEGLVLLREERYADALAHFAELLALPDLERQVQGRILNSRAYIYHLHGQIEAAMDDLHNGLALWRALGDPLNEGKALLNLGILAYELREYAAAENHLSAAERSFQGAGSAQMVAAVQNELGLLCRDQGRWSDALTYLNASAAQAQVEGATDALAIAWLNIGEVLLLQGQLDEAERAFQRALAIMPGRTHQVDLYLGLGLLNQVRGQWAAAQQAFLHAQMCAEEVGRRDILAEVHFRLGEVQRLHGDDAAALAEYEQAAATVELVRSPIRAEGLKISLLGRWQPIYERLVLHALQMGDVAAAWAWTERARARAFAEQLNSPDPVSNTDEQSPFSLTALQNVLPPESVLLSYFATGVIDQHAPFERALATHSPLRDHLLIPPHTLSFVISREAISLHECPINPNALLSSSQRHEDRNRFLTPKMLAQLAKILLPPALPASPQQIFVSPHGPLHHMPFAALRGADGHPLVRMGGPYLSYAPSGAILYQQRLQSSAHRTAARHPCLAIGYDGQAPLRSLRYTEREALWVANLTGGDVWTGDQPKKVALQKAAGKYRWLHLACHAWFDFERPLASYLETGPDERLTAEEVLRDWRIDAELVTLSACQTGVHRLLRGDEPMGLIRAFLTAGAQIVIATQWPVEDLPTWLLMEHFYRRLVDEPSMHPAAALRDAQVWLRTASAEAVRMRLNRMGVETGALPADDPPFADPRFWAGFVVFGG
jgi:CHAT domain-containing protein/tetratricopeptide (TPR) repeat protein